MKQTKYKLFYRKLFKSIVITLIITSSIGLTNFFISSVVAKSSPINQQHSNVILIVADDLGYGDLGSYGQKIIQTPNLDRMASEGVRFTQFYSGSPSCRPARCTLMTGFHTGHCYLRVNSMEAGFRDKDFTIAEALKQKNIVTGVIGKWALGEENSLGVPSKQGFDYFYGYLNQRHAHNSYPEFLIEDNKKVSLQNEVPNSGKNGEGFATVKKEYSNDLFTNKAIDFISTHKDEQFFLYLPYTIPHANNSGKQAATLEVPELGVYENMNLSDSQKSYAAMVTRLDSYIGRIISELEKQEIQENTLVIFTSDNGPHSKGGYHPEMLDSNSNLKGGKFDLNEGGIRVPLIVWSPGLIKEGMVSEHISYFPDIFPTITHVSGINQKYLIDGISLYPTLIGNEEAQQQHQYLYWEYLNIKKSQAVRTGDWKSITTSSPITTKLYNLRNDLNESIDVSQKYPDIVSNHQKILRLARENLPLMDRIRLFFAIRQKILVSKFRRLFIVLTSQMVI